MDETLANLMIILKTVGLNESKTGLRELEGVLKATGLSADALAAVLQKSAKNLEDVVDLGTAHAQANRDAAEFTRRFSTEQERLNAELRRLSDAQPHMTIEKYNAALADLERRMRALHSLSVDGPVYGPARPTDAQRLSDAIAAGREREAAAARNAAQAERDLAEARRNAAQAERDLAEARRNAARYSGSGDPSGAFGPFQEAAGPARPDRDQQAYNIGVRLQEQSAQDAIRLANQQATADRTVTQQIQAQNAEQERRNFLQMQAGNLIRQLATPEEAHAERLRHYNQLLREGAINQELFDRASANSERAMRLQTSLGGRGGGLASMQAGYAVQDFATVMAMGGDNALGRAFMSASNNLGQMVVVAGVLRPELAALVATGATLAAVLGPQLWESMTSGANSAKDAMRQLALAASDVAAALPTAADRLERTLSLARDLKTGSSSTLQGRLDNSNDRISVIRQAMSDNNTLLQNRPDMVASPESVDAAVKAYNAEFRKVYDSYTKGANPGNLSIQQIQGAAQAAANNAYMNEINKDQRIRDLKMEQLKLAQELKDTEEDRLKIQDALAGRLKIEAQQEFAKEQESAKGVGVKAGDRIGQMLLQSNRQAAIAGKSAASQQFQMTDAITEFFGNLINDPNLSPEARRDYLQIFGKNQLSQIDSTISDLKDQGKSRTQPGFSSFSDFGRSIQMALLKPEDEAKKQRDKQIKLLEDAKIAIEQQTAAMVQKLGVGE